jgi:hypothetical protein
MRYSLEKDSNGRITQCDNADGNGNVYAQRKEINKLALENLKRPTPGKLGELGNCQVFNFSFNDTAWPTSTVLNQEFNTTVTTANATYAVMFGVDSLNDKAQYFNIVDMQINLYTATDLNLTEDSYIEWYLLENIETSTTSVGRKIARRYPIFGADSSATFDFTTTGAKQGYQYISSPIGTASNPINTIMPKGIRASGIALKTIFANSLASEAWADVTFSVIVQVDTTSVSTTY